MLRFLHLADIHLETRFLARDRDLRLLLREAQKEAFRRAVDCALEEDVDCVLIAGDLFDSRRLTFATERFLLDQLGRLDEASIQAVCVTGNHDSGEGHFEPHRIQWPPSFTLLDDPVPRTIAVHNSEGKVSGRVTGAGYGRRFLDVNLASSFPAVQNRKVPEVGLLHSWVTSAKTAERHDRYAPCSVSDLRGKGYSYWALGHIHLAQQVDQESGAWYAGVLQGRNPRESGLKGGLLVSISDNDLRVEFRTFARVRWEEITLDGIDQVHNLSDLTRLAVQAFDERRRDDATTCDWLVSLCMKGSCPLADQLLEETYREELEEDLAVTLGARYVQLRIPYLVKPLDLDSYRGEAHILGETLRLIEEVTEEAGLLEKFAPDELASNEFSAAGRLPYLKSLLDGLDLEAANLFVSPDHAD